MSLHGTSRRERLSILVLIGTLTLFILNFIGLAAERAGMVDHPATYPWLSYQANALGKAIQLWQPLPAYLSLGNTADERVPNQQR